MFWVPPMEAVSSFIATVAAPPFQTGAEEAKKTANTRDTIPQTTQAARSANTGVSADGRGTTSGTNSQLYAQSEALISASTSQLKEKKNSLKDKVRADNKKSADTRTEGTKGSARGSSSAAVSSQSANNAAAKSGGAGAEGEIQATKKIGTVSREGADFSGARFSETANSHLGADNMTRSSVIANRYNTSFHAQYLTKGQNINYSI